MEKENNDIVQLKKQLTQNMNLGRMGEPEDIAGVVAFLAGPEGAWINGQQIIANRGGRM